MDQKSETLSILQSLKEIIAKIKPQVEKEPDPNDPFEKLETDGKLNRLHAMCQDHANMIKNVYAGMNDVYGQIWNLHEKNYDTKAEFHNKLEDHKNTHQKGHFPPLTAGQLKKGLDACGAGDDHEIKKPMVNCSAAHRYPVANITLDIK